MVQDIQLRVLPQIASDSSLIINYIAEEKGIDARTIKAIRIVRRSIDARQRQVYVNLTVRTYVNEEPTDLAYTVTEYPDVSNGKQVIVVGEGPAGLFAALRLIEHGLKLIRKISPDVIVSALGDILVKGTVESIREVLA
jgi:uncharacterized FAD-dependent dehydrogenase